MMIQTEFDPTLNIWTLSIVGRASLKEALVTLESGKVCFVDILGTETFFSERPIKAGATIDSEYTEFSISELTKVKSCTPMIETLPVYGDGVSDCIAKYRPDLLTLVKDACQALDIAFFECSDYPDYVKKLAEKSKNFKLPSQVIFYYPGIYNSPEYRNGKGTAVLSRYSLSTSVKRDIYSVCLRNYKQDLLTLSAHLYEDIHRNIHDELSEDSKSRISSKLQHAISILKNITPRKKDLERYPMLMSTLTELANNELYPIQMTQTETDYIADKVSRFLEEKEQ